MSVVIAVVDLRAQWAADAIAQLTDSILNAFALSRTHPTLAARANLALAIVVGPSCEFLVKLQKRTQTSLPSEWDNVKAAIRKLQQLTTNWSQASGGANDYIIWQQMFESITAQLSEIRKKSGSGGAIHMVIFEPCNAQAASTRESCHACLNRLPILASKTLRSAHIDVCEIEGGSCAMQENMFSGASIMAEPGHGGADISDDVENDIQVASSTQDSDEDVGGGLAREVHDDDGVTNRNMSASNVETISKFKIPINLSKVPKDVFALQRIWYRYFWEMSPPDRENVRLVIPTSTTGASDELVLKVDIMPRLMHTEELGLTKQFGLQLEERDWTHAIPSTRSSTDVTTTTAVKPLAILRAVKCVPLDGICESFLFGYPLVIRPTLAWTLETVDLYVLLNNQVQSNVPDELGEQSHALILQRDMDELSGIHVKAHFLLLPSAGNTMLLRSIATSEMVMPEMFSEAPETHKPSVYKNRMSAWLQQLPTQERYLPGDYNAEALKALVQRCDKHALDYAKRVPEKEKKKRGDKSNAAPRKSKSVVEQFAAAEDQHHSPSEFDFPSENIAPPAVKVPVSKPVVGMATTTATVTAVKTIVPKPKVLSGTSTSTSTPATAGSKTTVSNASSRFKPVVIKK